MTSSFSDNKNLIRSHTNRSFEGLTTTDFERKIEKDVEICTLSKSKFLHGAYSQKLTSDQKLRRDKILQEHIQVQTSSLLLPTMNFTAEKLCNFLTLQLQTFDLNGNLMDAGPFLIGGAALHVLMDPTATLKHSDLDICYYLKVPSQNIGLFIIEFLQNEILDRFNELTVKDPKSEREISEYIKLQAYRSLPIKKQKEEILKYFSNKREKPPFWLFTLGKLDIKFFLDMTARQNIAISDSFRISVKGNDVLCVDANSVCDESGYRNAIEALEKRNFIIKKPHEVDRLMFRCAHRMTQGFVINDPEIFIAAWKEINNTFFSKDLELIGEVIHKHHRNHYADDEIGKLFDFMNFTSIILQMASKGSESSEKNYCELLANRWIKSATPSDLSSPLGYFCTLISKNPDLTSHFIALLQGYLFFQKINENPHISAYSSPFDPHKVRQQLSFKTGSSHYFMTLSQDPIKLSQAFITSWMLLNEKKLLLPLSPILEKFNVFTIQSLKELGITTSKLLTSFKQESMSRILKLFPHHNLGLFCSFLKDHKGLQIDDRELDVYILQNNLKRHSDGAEVIFGKKFQTFLETIQSIIAFQDSSLENLKKIGLLLDEVPTVSIEKIGKSLRTSLSRSFLQLIKTQLHKPTLELIQECEDIFFQLEDLNFFTEDDSAKCYSIILFAHENLLPFSKIENCLIMAKSLQKLSLWKSKNHSHHEHLQKLFLLLKQQIFNLTEKLIEELSIPEMKERTFELLLKILSLPQDNEKIERQRQKMIKPLITYVLTNKTPSNLIQMASAMNIILSYSEYDESTMQLIANLISEISLINLEQAQKIGLTIENLQQINLTLIHSIESKVKYNRLLQKYFLKQMANTLFESKKSNKELFFSIFSQLFLSLKSSREEFSDIVEIIKELASFKLPLEQIQIRFANVAIYVDDRLGMQILLKTKLPITEKNKQVLSILHKQGMSDPNLAYDSWIEMQSSFPSPITQVHANLSLFAAFFHKNKQKKLGKESQERMNILKQQILLSMSKKQLEIKELTKTSITTTRMLESALIGTTELLIRTAATEDLCFAEELLERAAVCDLFTSSVKSISWLHLIDAYVKKKELPSEKTIKNFLYFFFGNPEIISTMPEMHSPLIQTICNFTSFGCQLKDPDSQSLAFTVITKTIDSKLLSSEDLIKVLGTRSFDILKNSSIKKSQKEFEDFFLTNFDNIISYLDNSNDKILFFISLMQFENYDLWQNIFKQIKSIIPKTEKPIPDFIKLCEVMCQQASALWPEKTINEVCIIFKNVGISNPIIFKNLLKILSTNADIRYYSFFEKYFRFNAERSDFPSVESLDIQTRAECYTYLFKYIHDLYMKEPKPEYEVFLTHVWLGASEGNLRNFFACNTYLTEFSQCIKLWIPILSNMNTPESLIKSAELFLDSPIGDDNSVQTFMQNLIALVKQQQFNPVYVILDKFLTLESNKRKRKLLEKGSKSLDSIPFEKQTQQLLSTLIIDFSTELVLSIKKEIQLAFVQAETDTIEACMKYTDGLLKKCINRVKFLSRLDFLAMEFLRGKQRQKFQTIIVEYLSEHANFLKKLSLTSDIVEKEKGNYIKIFQQASVFFDPSLEIIPLYALYNPEEGRSVIHSIAHIMLKLTTPFSVNIYILKEVGIKYKLYSSKSAGLRTVKDLLKSELISVTKKKIELESDIFENLCAQPSIKKVSKCAFDQFEKLMPPQIEPTPQNFQDCILNALFNIRKIIIVNQLLESDTTICKNFLGIFKTLLNVPVKKEIIAGVLSISQNLIQTLISYIHIFYGDIIGSEKIDKDVLIEKILKLAQDADGLFFRDEKEISNAKPLLLLQTLLQTLSEEQFSILLKNRSNEGLFHLLEEILKIFTNSEFVSQLSVTHAMKPLFDLINQIEAHGKKLLPPKFQPKFNTLITAIKERVMSLGKLKMGILQLR